MLFNSLEFLYFFLPITYFIYFLLTHKTQRYVWLTITGYETTTGDRLGNGVGRGAPRYSREVRGYLFFKHPGCWRVNARWGPAHLGFVVRVLDPPAKARGARSPSGSPR